MKRLLSLFFMIFIISCSTQEKDVTIISGKLVGYDGNPLKKANIKLSFIGKIQPFFLNLKDDGSYEIKTDHIGCINIEFAGVNHFSKVVPFLLSKQEKIELHVQLKAYDYTHDFSNIKIFGNYNDWSKADTALFNLNENGTYSTTVESENDTLLYQLSGILEHNKTKIVNGTNQDDFIYDGRGGFRSILFSGKGLVNIIFDPRKIVNIDKESYLEFADTNSVTAKYYSLNEWLQSYRNEHDWEKVAEKIFTKIKVEQDIDTKSILCYLYMANYFNTERVDLNKAKKILQIIPPSSIVWTKWPDLPVWYYYILPPEDRGLADAYIERVSNENKYPPVKSEAINYFLSLAEMDEDSVKIRRFYNRLITECPKSMRAKAARFKYEILASGKNVPSFSVTSIDKPEEVYTEKSLLGKVYLIEFWATTCGHCIAEMPYLHDAYKKYKEKGFEILSLSMDNSPVEVTEFRNGEWKMPWLHAFLKDGEENEIAKIFGVGGTPTPILVDAEGKIIVTKSELRSDSLDKTLASILE